jgi:muramidase (phage lysozyme)
VPQGSLLDFIGKKESNGNYNILVGGKTEPNLTNMTIAEVIQFQKGMKSRGHESTAVGKYQIIRKTLEGLVAAGYARMDEKFSPQTQDKLAVGLLKIRGLNKYLSGKMPPEQFADNLSKEWASLPYKTGASYYAGVGSNKSSGSREAFVNLVKAGNIGMGGTMTATYTPSEPTSSSGGMMNTSYSEAPKSVYNPVARPAAKQQQAVAASQEAQNAGNNPYGFTPSSVRTSDTATATNASKNTLTGVSMENTERILTESLNIQTQTLNVMKMIHEKINAVNPGGNVNAGSKATTASYDYPKSPVPMKKGMRA